MTLFAAPRNESRPGVDPASGPSVDEQDPKGDQQPGKQQHNRPEDAPAGKKDSQEVEERDGDDDEAHQQAPAHALTLNGIQVDYQERRTEEEQGNHGCQPTSGTWSTPASMAASPIRKPDGMRSHQWLRSE